MIRSRSSEVAGQDPVGTGQHLLDLGQVRQHQQHDTDSRPASERGVSCHTAPAAD